jgi:hypothetical protein
MPEQRAAAGEIVSTVTEAGGNVAGAVLGALIAGQDGAVAGAAVGSPVALALTTREWSGTLARPEPRS